MSSKPPPPSTHSSTKYGDLPPRFRKLWIEGNAERVQRKLDDSVETFTFSMPSHQSSSESNLPGNIEVRSSRSAFKGKIGRIASSSSSLPPSHKRLRTNEDTLTEPTNRSGECGFLEKEKESNSAPILYKGSASMKQIVNSVVAENIIRSTPPASRSTSPSGPLNPQSKYGPSSLSRPSTRASSPVTGSGSRPITPNPTGWIPLTSRHSSRRFENRPWGPRHLEYDYNEARKEFQGAAYYALGQYGYIPPKGVTKFKAPALEVLPSMSDLRKVPEFLKACKRLDAADRVLEEALARGATWDNTPIPDEYLQLSLEHLKPEEIRRERPDKAVEGDRKRSSVELEEAAGQTKKFPLSLSSTTSTSTTTSTYDLEENLEELDGGGPVSSRNMERVSLSDDKQPQPLAISGYFSPTVSDLDSEIVQKYHLQLALLKKRLQEERQSDTKVMKRRNSVAETSEPGGSMTRLSSLAPTPPLSGQVTPVRLRRSQSRSGSTGSGSSSGSGSGVKYSESPPTSVSTSTRKTRSSNKPVRRVPRMRAAKSGS